jgi:hypothetical protein
LRLHYELPLLLGRNERGRKGWGGGGKELGGVGRDDGVRAATKHFMSLVIFLVFAFALLLS